MGSLVDVIGMGVLPEGSIGYALKELSDETLALPGVAAQVALAQQAVARTTQTRVRWKASKQAPDARGEAVALDARIDRLLGSMAMMCKSWMHSLVPSDAIYQAAAELMTLALPEGAAQVTTLSFEDELNYVQHMLARIDAAGDLADRVGVSPLIAQLKVLVPQFEAELKKRPEIIEHSVLRDHEAQMQRALAAVIVTIAAAHVAPGADAALAKALAPITEQIERVRRARKARRRVRDVDPITGEEV